MPPTGTEKENLTTPVGWWDGKITKKKAVSVLQMVFCSWKRGGRKQELFSSQVLLG